MKGQAFLALVFIIGAIVILTGVTLALFASSFVDSGYGYQASAEAQAVATAGVEDALLQLNRNANFPCSTVDASGYALPVGSSTATVTVTQTCPATSGSATILSVATVSSHTSKLTVVASVNASTSQVNVVSWTPTQ
ncbi:MAG TPA: hypothetical protein VHZ04_02890 [Candidatus Paceibacterota bacterium]|nr:hypothetical protein [Candidatus Paceibacterota bacterium]